jgi:hypothetical protein
LLFITLDQAHPNRFFLRGAACELEREPEGIERGSDSNSLELSTRLLRHAARQLSSAAAQNPLGQWSWSTEVGFARFECMRRWAEHWRRTVLTHSKNKPEGGLSPELGGARRALESALQT